MSARRKSSRWALLGGLIAVAGMTQVALSVDWTALDPAAAVERRMAAERASHAGVVAEQMAPAAPMTEAELPCFGCHSYERYRTETRFDHAAHAAAGHCHVCHAFEGHFQVSIRKATCVECHNKEQ